MPRLMLILALFLSACAAPIQQPTSPGEAPAPSVTPLAPPAQEIYELLVGLGIRKPLCKLPYTDEDFAVVGQLNRALPEITSALLRDEAGYTHEEIAQIIRDGAGRASGQVVGLTLTEGQNSVLAAIAGGYCRAGSHDFAPTRFFVLDKDGSIIEAGTVGFAPYVEPAPEGWVIASTQSNISYGWQHFEVWHLTESGVKTSLAEYETGSIEVDGDTLVIHIDLLSPAPPPCEFTAEVRDKLYNTIYHDGQRVYRWEDGAYALQSDTFQVTVIVNFSNDPASPFPPGELENWEAYCID